MLTIYVQGQETGRESYLRQINNKNKEKQARVKTRKAQKLMKMDLEKQVGSSWTPNQN